MITTPVKVSCLPTISVSVWPCKTHMHIPQLGQQCQDNKKEEHQDKTLLQQRYDQQQLCGQYQGRRISYSF